MLYAGGAGMALIYVWLRLSTMKQLDWHRGSSYQSKDIAHTRRRPSLSAWPTRYVRLCTRTQDHCPNRAPATPCVLIMPDWPLEQSCAE